MSAEWQLSDKKRGEKLGEVVQALLADLPDHFKSMEIPSGDFNNSSNITLAQNMCNQFEITTKLDSNGSQTIKHGSRKLLN